MLCDFCARLSGVFDKENSVTIDEQIEILRAVKDGKTVERRVCGSTKWHRVEGEQVFSFTSAEYRIAEEKWRDACTADFFNGPTPARFWTIDVGTIDLAWVAGVVIGCKWHLGRFVWIDSDGHTWAKCQVRDT